jgi:formylglycine-generating enzyme required for sulfatase activity
MKNKVKLFGIIALAVVIGFAMVACDSPGGGGGSKGGNNTDKKNNTSDGETTFTITIQNDGNGTASADKETAEAGEKITISAMPNIGFKFQKWEVVSGNVTLSTSTGSPAEFTMPSRKVTIKAFFEALPPDTPNLVLDPAVVAFSSVDPGYSQPAAISIAIKNTGTGTATVSSIQLNNDSYFTLSGHGEISAIAVGETANFSVQPKTGLGVGTHNAVLTVSYDASRTVTAGVSITVNHFSSIVMVQIPSGTFLMGSPGTEPSRNTTNENYRTANSGNVTVSGFWMGKYQVTQAEWKAVMGESNNPSYFTGNNLPVEMVSWYDVIVFCNRLSIKEGLIPAYQVSGVTNWETQTAPTIDTATWNSATINPSSDGYRLPTEAQWEYACRAGTTTAFNWGSNQITSAQANFNAASNLYNGSTAGIFRNTTTAVGIFAANTWGLHDMHGNVFEWCWDRYTASYNDAGGSTDPQGATSGTHRVFRGGSWDGYGQNLRSAYRVNYYPWYRSYYIGFRLVRP